MTKTVGDAEQTYAERNKSQMRKGFLEYCTLLVLKHKPLYSSDILKSLKEAELLVVEGTLYPLLNRLKRAELLQYEWKESTSGPPRKYYELTDNGKEVLKQFNAEWKALSNTISKLQ